MLRRLLPEKDPLPNKFTWSMGKLIREAREERGLSQTELGESIYRRQAAVSQMENGQMEPSAITLMRLAAALEKPITYFFPRPWKRYIPQEDLSSTEQELIMEFRELPDIEQRMIVEEVKLKRKIAVKIHQEEMDELYTEWDAEDEAKSPKDNK